jgi:FtsZ-interacting cell division protein ZipA
MFEVRDGGGSMSTVLIAVIAVIVVALIVLAFLVPRMRNRAEVKRRQEELEYRREQVASAHREAAAESEQRAEVASQRARIAEQEARSEQAEAELAKARATMHEHGLADQELVDESERADFEGTSAVPDAQSEESLAGDQPATNEASGSVRPS